MRWKVQDFKGIREAEVTLDEGTVTFLVGTNSSGKSSLAQSLLLTAQSHYDRGPMVLNGPLVQLGSAEDVIREPLDGEKTQMRFSVASDSDEEFLALNAGYEVSGTANTASLEVSAVEVKFQTEPNLSPLSIRFSRDHARTDDLRLARRFGTASNYLHLKQIAEGRRALRSYVGMDGLRPTELVILYKEEQLAALFEKSMREALTQRSVSSPDSLYAMVAVQRALMSAANSRSAPVKLRNAMRGVANGMHRPGGIYEEWEKTDERIREEVLSILTRRRTAKPYIRLPIELLGNNYYFSAGDPFEYEVYNSLGSTMKALGALSKEIDDLVTSIQYLGPLRDEPRVVWGQWNQLARGLPVGRRGETTAAVLARSGARRVNYCGPDGEMRSETIRSAVDDWLGYLQIGEGATTHDRGKLGVGLRVSHAGRQRDLTSVGVGVSQALPIVVALLTAPPRAKLFLEQPELHLHPAVQARLADFLARARPDVCVVAETHSDSLITRVRLRVAQASLDAKRVNIVFVEPSGTGSVFRRIEVSEHGDLSEWPEGFLAGPVEDVRELFMHNARRRKSRG